MLCYSTQLDTAHSVCWKVGLSHNFTQTVSPEHETSRVSRLYHDHILQWTWWYLRLYTVESQKWILMCAAALWQSCGHIMGCGFCYTVFHISLCLLRNVPLMNKCVNQYEHIIFIWTDNEQWTDMKSSRFIKMKFTSQTSRKFATNITLEWLQNTCSKNWWQQALRFHSAHWRAY